MHPDALIAGLEAELAELEQEKPKDLDERRKAIKAEIERVDELPRPTARPEEPETVFDRARAILEALETELREAVEEDHKSAIKAEIKRIEGEIRERDNADTSERAERKTSRATNKPQAERAVSAPAK